VKGCAPPALAYNGAPGLQRRREGETGCPPPSLHVFRRVALRNYRSIQRCDVTLEPLTFLVGPNGSGKSNFLDALRLSAEGLRGTLEQALRERGGIAEVRRRSTGHPTDFAVSLSLVLGAGSAASLGLRGRRAQGWRVFIKREQMIVGAAPL
jgi:predicted ATPase